MHYSEIADCYQRIESLSSRNEITEEFSRLLKSTPKSEIPQLVYLTQGKLRPDYEGVELGLAEKNALKILSSVSGLSQSDIMKVYVRQGDIGDAAEFVLKTKSQGTLFAERLTLDRVYETLLRVARTAGEGSVETKQREVSSLLNDASPLEAKFIMRTLTGVLRLGVADYTVLDACSSAFLGGKSLREVVERAYNHHPDLGLIVQTAASKGVAGVKKVRLEVGIPVRPMLAERLQSPEAVLKKLGNTSVVAEYKLDGERLQIHKKGEKVQLFSRRLEVVTGHYPDAVELTRSNIDAARAVLEAEVVAIDEDTGEFLPFQELMHRRRKHGVDEAVRKYPVALNFFDILLLGNRDVTGEPYTKRRELLAKSVKETARTRVVPALTSSDPVEIEGFMEQAISDGCEGLVVKDPASPYRAGAREFAWIKLKREYRSELTDTIDLPIVGAFHGKGRRAGTYGTYLLAAFDRQKSIFSSVAKVGTGFTDEDLKALPKALKPYQSAVRPANVESTLKPDVWFRPHLVIETIASELTLSPIHTAGMGRVREGSGISLRFPKFTGRVREDKVAEDSTTVDEIVAMYNSQLKKVSKSA